MLNRVKFILIKQFLMRNYKQRFQSKVFANYNPAVTINRDDEHQKVWSQKVQQAKHIQQLKQIDKIFQGIIKERIFGNIISEKSRLSNQQYSTLDKINKTYTSSFRKKTRGIVSFNSTAKSSPIKRELNQQVLQTPIKKLNKKSTLQPLSNTFYGGHNIDRERKMKNKLQRKIKNIARQFQILKETSQQKSPVSSYEKNDLKFPSRQLTANLDVLSMKSKKLSRIQSSKLLKQLQLDTAPQFPDYFKSLSLTPNLYLDQIKISRQTLIMKAKSKKIIDQRLIEYFLYFFGFQNQMNFRQFKKNMQKAVNCPIQYIYFFIFRIIDESGNGFLTISDIFRFMQKYPNNTYIQPEIFLITNQIEKISRDLIQKRSSQDRQIKASLEQILLTNQKLKLDQVHQLLKKSGTREVQPSSYVRITCYSQSVSSLEHDVNVRFKQYQLQQTKNQSIAAKQNQNKQDTRVQDGMRLKDFVKIFQSRRPKIFCSLINILTGLANENYE